jgi:TolB-like protein/DNA-binding winged helix-turn-helix (wHTH) protein/Tfp pilus assembly protein PilF
MISATLGLSVADFVSGSSPLMFRISAKFQRGSMATSVPSRPVQRFGGFEVDPRSRELRRKGKRVRMQDQPLEVLLLLLERSGEVVTREELKERLWPADTFVDSDDGLNGAVRKLREALGDSAEEPQYIETIPRRGYRFIGALEEEAAQPESGSKTDTVNGLSQEPPSKARNPRTRWLRLGAIFIVVSAVTGVLGWIAFKTYRARGGTTTAISSLVVLPFANLSGDPSQEYFADAMTDEMTSDLAKIGAMRVISRTSAMHYKGTSKTLPEIARELNVDGVIEGSVLRAGGRVRITVQLISAPSERHIWSESYERDLADILTLQSELSRTIAGQVRVAITPAEERHLHPESVNPAAYDDYLLGTYFSRKLTPPAIEKARAHFLSAIRTDPNFALAYAGLAKTYLEGEVWEGVGIGKSSAEVRAATRKALELDNNLAEGHALMGRVHFSYDWDWKGTEEEYRRSIELNPGLPEAHEFYAFFLQAIGHQEEAIAEAHRAVELDPLAPSCLSDEGRILYRARQYDKAIVDFKRALEIDPAFVPALSRVIDVYDQQAQFDEALHYTKLFQEQVSDRRVALPYLALIYAHMGKRREAIQVLQQLEAARDLRRNDSGMIEIYAALGDRDRAIASLDRAIKDRSILPVAFVDPDMDPLRSDSRFIELRHRVDLQ